MRRRRLVLHFQHPKVNRGKVVCGQRNPKPKTTATPALVTCVSCKRTAGIILRRMRDRG